MASTPAQRASQDLKRGGLKATNPAFRWGGVKVQNLVTATHLPQSRRLGSPVVAITVDVEVGAEGLASRAADILTRAGWGVTVHEDGCHLYLVEPEWRKPGEPGTEWLAIRMSDGLIEVHVTGCPAIPVVGKSMTVTGRTREAIAAEDLRRILPHGHTTVTPRLVKVHDCTTPEPTSSENEGDER